MLLRLKDFNGNRKTVSYLIQPSIPVKVRMLFYKNKHWK